MGFCYVLTSAIRGHAARSCIVVLVEAALLDKMLCHAVTCREEDLRILSASECNPLNCARVISQSSVFQYAKLYPRRLVTYRQDILKMRDLNCTHCAVVLHTYRRRSRLRQQRRCPQLHLIPDHAISICTPSLLYCTMRCNVPSECSSHCDNISSKNVEAVILDWNCYSSKELQPLCVVGANSGTCSRTRFTSRSIVGVCADLVGDVKARGPSTLTV